MLADTKAFSSFAVDDVAEAKRFYDETLGLEVSEVDPGSGLIQLDIAGDRPVLIYDKGAAHQPAEFTILNFPVDDVVATVTSLTERGVEFERYEGTEMATDEQGVFRGGGPLIAWFKDPAWNILSVIEESPG